MNKLEKIRLGHGVLEVIYDVLHANCDTVQGVVAGGIVRDAWAEQEYGIDLGGSGDVDICIFRLQPDAWNSETSTEILDQLRIHGFNAKWDLSSLTSSFNERLDAVFQFTIDGVNIDVLMYKPAYDTMGKVMASFNCSLNRFAAALNLLGDVQITNWGFCPKNPEMVYEQAYSTEPEANRVVKMQHRFQMVREAHIAKSSQNPYANIRG
jgi:hypothetical protein